MREHTSVLSVNTHYFCGLFCTTQELLSIGDGVHTHTHTHTYTRNIIKNLLKALSCLLVIHVYATDCESQVTVQQESIINKINCTANLCKKNCYPLHSSAAYSKYLEGQYQNTLMAPQVLMFQAI